MIKEKEIQVLEKEIDPIVGKAGKIVIKTADDMPRAVEMLSLINQYSDTVQEKKETITKPLNLTIKNVRAMFKPLEDKLETAIGGIRQAMTKYQTEEVAKQRVEEAKIAARLQKGNIKLETAVKKMDEVEKAPSSVETDSGVVKFKTIKKFRVVDKTIVPMEYLVVDEVAVRKAMLAGIEVKGVQYHEEQVPMNFR